MRQFYESVWFLPSALLVIGLLADVVRRALLRRDERIREAETAQRSYRYRRMEMDAMSPAMVNAKFRKIAAKLRAEADQRICEAHERNMSELPEIEGGGRG